MLNCYVERQRGVYTLKVVAGDRQLGESKVKFKESPSAKVRLQFDSVLTIGRSME